MHISVRCKIIIFRLFTKKNLSDNIKKTCINDKIYHCELLCYHIFHLRCLIFLVRYGNFYLRCLFFLVRCLIFLVRYGIFHLRCSLFLFSYDIFLVRYCIFQLFCNICAFYSNLSHFVYNSRHP